MEHRDESKAQPEIILEEKFTCITPSVANLTTSRESFARVLDSHNWEVRRIEQQTADQILVQVLCQDCGLSRISIVSDIADSAERAEQGKLKKNEEKTQQQRYVLADA